MTTQRINIPFAEGYAAYWDAYPRVSSNRYDNGEEKLQYDKGWLIAYEEDDHKLRHLVNI